jgi:hypothetical protein
MKAILADPAIKKAMVSISPTSRQNQLMRKPTFRASKTPKRRRYAQEAEQMDAPAPTCSKRFARRSRPTIRYPMIGQLGIRLCPILDNFSGADFTPSLAALLPVIDVVFQIKCW